MDDDSETVLTRDQLRQATEVRPSPRQLAWQRCEFNAFVHYGPNAFTDRAWGTGEEDPDVFAPEDLDADQWVRAAKAAGMEIVTLTAKHHDGFCLWPSRYTDHSVAESEWRDGEGDVVRELADACRRHGLKLGLYLSPADIHEAVVEGGRYGNGSEVRERTIPLPADREHVDDREFTLEVDDYNAYFASQLFELLTEYGPVHQVWFDGAHPEETQGDTQEYQNHEWYRLIRELAPEAVISINGPDVRWCGNEAGDTREAEWSVVPLPPGADSVVDADYDLTDMDFPGDDLLAEAEEFAWYPSETDTTVRPGWFYHSEKDPRFDLDDVRDIWYRTVGGNSVLLLNLAPAPSGRVPEGDVEMLERLGDHLRETFDEDLTAGADAEASGVRDDDPDAYGPGNVLAADPAAYWMTDDWQETGTLTLTLPEPRTGDVAVVQEAIGARGQRITGVELEGRTPDGEWVELGTAETVGYKRILRFEERTVDALRLRVTGARVCPTVSEVGLYRRAD
ncbi:MAG: alpha-L-fucosidase [Haloferacaceae archaeon]